MQIRKGRTQHRDELPRRVGAPIIHARWHLVIEEVWRDQFVYESKVALVEHLLKGTAILRLVFFFSCRHVFDSFASQLSHGHWNLLVRSPCSAQSLPERGVEIIGKITRWDYLFLERGIE